MGMGSKRRGLALRVEELAVVAYTVAAARVQPLVGEPFKLHQLPDRDETIACVVSACACFRWAGSDDMGAAPAIRMVSHSVFAAREQRHGPLLLRANVAPPALAALLRIATPLVNGARLSTTEGPVRQRSELGRDAQMTSHRLETADGDVELELAAGSSGAGGDEPRPGASGLQEYLLGSNFAFFRLRGRYVWKLPVWAPVTLQPATIVRARLPFWQETGVLTASEMGRPAAAFTAKPFTTRVGLPHPDMGL